MQLEDTLRGDTQHLLRNRRQKLAILFERPAILWSGQSSSRNFPRNTYPFRASSHFLYFAGLSLENAAIRLEAGRLELFIDEGSPDNALWHGEMPKPADIAAAIGADAVFPLAELVARVKDAATIAVQDAPTQAQQSLLLGRTIHSQGEMATLDRDLANAIISLRLTHDESALTELRKAAKITVAAHLAGMAATRNAKREADIRAAMEAAIAAANMSCSYQSIVTVHGEVLHNNQYQHPLSSGDLILADVGAETAMGWAGDVTRTWPVFGHFSDRQREIYEIVLIAHDTCIANIKPGVEYLDIHLLACRTIAAGLEDLGILKGKIDDLIEMDAHALFFPHGVGHLLGLDVHDMEDLGDLAGYETGRVRSDRFGLCYLRLNRSLRAGMLVTIEPGFYQVPAILNDPERRAKFKDVVNWDRLAQFADVRGIRIENDILVTETDCEVLTVTLPTDPDAIEQQLAG